MRKYYKNYKQTTSLNFIGKRKNKCKHLWVQWSDGIILAKPYCLNCGKLQPKEEWDILTKSVNDMESED